MTGRDGSSPCWLGPVRLSTPVQGRVTCRAAPLTSRSSAAGTTGCRQPHVRTGVREQLKRAVCLNLLTVGGESGENPPIHERLVGQFLAICSVPISAVEL
jgi:hypothetical protein